MQVEFNLQFDILAIVTFRYKEPDGMKSMLLEHVVENSRASEGEASANFQWAAAVASFGMLLRDSEFKGESSLGMVQTLAQAGKGEDPYGYRAEFLQLVNRTNATEAYR